MAWLVGRVALPLGNLLQVGGLKAARGLNYSSSNICSGCKITDDDIPLRWEMVATLQLAIRPSDDGYGDPPEVVDIVIDGQNLVDIIRAYELPLATREGHPDIAGGYQGSPPRAVFLPSRQLLGEPSPYYSNRAGKTQLLQCTCGEAGCWPLMARVTITAEQVIWDQFEQPYRGPASRAGHWQYDELPPFVFGRRAYEDALVPPIPDGQAPKI